MKEQKPLFYVPSMQEIKKVKKNGLTVISTFAGGGGSSTGYRMSGYRVLWANEFDTHAIKTYRSNCDKSTIVDVRDIRKVTAEEILDVCDLKEGELDVLDGSPPCQTFSTAGKRQMTDDRSDLFFEFVRLLRGIKPKVFIAENVSGLVKGVAKGYFKWILREMKASGYRVVVRVLDAQWLGVPQRRRRVIFVGVREDIKVAPVHPSPLPYRYSVRDACPWIRYAEEDTGGQFSTGECTDVPSPTVCRGGVGHLKVALSRQKGSAFNYQDVKLNEPCGSVTIASSGNDLGVPDNDSKGKRKFTITELKRVCAFPDDFILEGSYAQQWAQLGNSVPPVMMFHVARTIADKILRKKNGGFRFDEDGGWQA